ncbi:ABC transporter permease [Desmospora profundinema]|uniref:ABC-type transport system involved in multi-copper enzyme maturation permease subunit n=1 Tax=Desmospora profundinema TaxID=1571184 RepID=A0ABU1INQ6_9BACL|nr:ABC transporter permease subunit [Desmospora profundinema]MDR6225599.1 ABC-type transport system involved in multi-copper enzyme maturation permease subunit [Desmospora profundinema]
MWTIAKLTAREIVYKRIFLVILLMSLAYLFFYALGTYYAGGKVVDNSLDVLARGFLSTQFLGMGLYFAAFIISLLAIFSSIGSISKEIESRQIDPLLSRPLSRHSFVWGRFVGLSGLLILYTTLLFVGVTIINQSIGGNLKADVTLVQLVQAWGLFLLQPVILVAASLFFSARFTTLNSGITMVMLYVISMIGGFIEQFGAMIKEQMMINIGIMISLVFPADSLFRKMTIALFDSADNPLSLATQGVFGSVSVPSNAMIVYACLYGVVALWMAVRAVSTRDL